MQVMQRITVQLQENYRYLLWPVVTLILAVFAAGILYALISRLVRKSRARRVDGEQAWRALTESEKYALRVKYFGLLDELSYKVGNNQISIRHCFQTLSKYVREFVSELTGVRVSRCTLYDIKWMNMPMLAALIEEFYAVEFAKVSRGDAWDAIAKTKRVIEIWN